MTEEFDKFIQTFLEATQTMEELNRDKPVYGFWISPSGEYTVVRTHMHDSIADLIISKNPNLIRKYKDRPESSANFLSKEKYLRVVFAPYTKMLLGDAFYYVKDESGEWVPERFDPTIQSLRTFKDLANFYGVRSRMEIR